MQPNPSPTWTRNAEAFGMMLRAIRHARGLSQQALATAVGITQYRHISEMESGKRKPGRAQLDRMCAVLDLDRDEAHARLGILPRDIEAAWLKRTLLRAAIRDMVDGTCGFDAPDCWRRIP